MTDRPDSALAHETLAAVDLGSNSFHLMIARDVGGSPVLVDRLREQVQLAAGLDGEHRLGTAARRRALACLHRFGQRLRALPRESVRAVATNTLRVARNARAFLEEAEAALGHPIEILPGGEEARLIYLGVAHTLARDEERRLVIDIGGGSTECILGTGFVPERIASLDMGCVGFTNRFFDDGRLKPRRFQKAVVAARLKVRTIREGFRERGWERVTGSSGTIRSIDEVLRAQGAAEEGITTRGLRKLREAMLAAGSIEALDLPGLKAERAPVLPGGWTVLHALFKELGIGRMEVSSGALREGVWYDLVGRLHHEDARERTIRLFEERYHVDGQQAARVERSALRLLEAVAEPWRLDREFARRFLSWAARLHEIGLAVSFAHHHGHGQYLVEHSDMPGFSRDDQLLLAVLIGTHRRRVRRKQFAPLPDRLRDLALRLAALVRVAVRLHRGRREQAPLPERIEASRGGLVLRFPSGWQEEHPLLAADLEKESRRLAQLGIRLGSA